MRIPQLVGVALMGLAFALPRVTPAEAQGVLRVQRGVTTEAIVVAVNRAIVMEADRAFAEISVANPAIADIATLSDRTIYVLGKSPGRTTLTLLGQNGRLITNVDVQVTPDLQEFKERLEEILPGEDIEVRTANGGIVLSGRVSGSRKLSRALELAERYAPGAVTNMMTVGGTQQVMLKVRFAEMERNVSKDLQSALTAQYVNSAGTQTFSTGLVGGLGSRSGLLSTVATVGDVTLTALLDALEEKGYSRTLAEPTLVAISGQDADFLAGGSIPLPVTNEDGSVTVTQQPFGVELEFNPVVVDEDLISLEMGVAISSLDFANAVTAAGFNLPAFEIDATTTNIELRDGQSFVVAGLLRDEFSDSIGQVPLLGDIPVLGALFRSTNFQREQSELVIIVTAHLVVPTDGDNIILPTERVALPREAELFMLGRVSGGARNLNDIATQDFQGDYGYVLD